MIRSVPLTQLNEAIDSNLPAGTIILDQSGNSVIFFKYKGTLVERDTPDFNAGTLRSRIKHALSRGSTLALKINESDDVTSYFSPDCIPIEIFHREKITKELLDSFSTSRDDYVFLDKDYRFTFVIIGSVIPACLQRFVESGDLVPVIIN